MKPQYLKAGIEVLFITPDNRCLIAGLDDFTIRFWDLRSEKEELTVCLDALSYSSHHARCRNNLRWRQTGKYLLSSLFRSAQNNLVTIQTR